MATKKKKRLKISPTKSRKKKAPTKPKRRKKKRVKRRLDPFAEKDLAKAARRIAKDIGTKYKIEGLYAREAEDVECISTGFQEIDDVLTGTVDDDGRIIKDTGTGFPRGRVIEIFGPEAAAKTTLALCVIAQAQQNGELCAFIDAEQALDQRYAEKVVGIRMRDLIFMQPDSGDQALAVVQELARQGVSVIVLDSVSALVSEEELKGGKALGKQARMMSKACRELTSILRPGGPLVIFINQIRYKIGVVFGNPEVTSGGNALKFYSSVRGRVKKVRPLKKTIKGEVLITGARIEFEVKKNKVGPALNKVTFDVRYNKGISIPRLHKKKRKAKPFGKKGLRK